jgi:hypothetical protein
MTFLSIHILEPLHLGKGRMIIYHCQTYSKSIFHLRDPTPYGRRHSMTALTLMVALPLTPTLPSDVAHGHRLAGPARPPVRRPTLSHRLLLLFLIRGRRSPSSWAAAAPRPPTPPLATTSLLHLSLAFGRISTQFQIDADNHDPPVRAYG